MLELKSVYLDNAATTALRPEVVNTMADVLKTTYGNASSTHSYGRSAKALVEQCRKRIAAHFGVSAGEIIFTSGGTEADNLALRSCVRDLGVTNIITSKIEHHAVLHTVNQLQKEYGVTVHYVDLDDFGTVDYNHLERLLVQTKAKTLVSLMHINNEIGNFLDLQRVSNLCKHNNAFFHSDAVQSVGHYTLNLEDIPIDFLAASAHKFHGPKGVGFCFVRKESGLQPLIFGGEQERGLRAGTESVHNIVGMTEALTMAYTNLDAERNHIKTLKQYFVDTLKAKLSDCHFNGHSGDIEKSTYTLINVCLPLPPEKATMLQFQLDLKGVACSKGSACQSGNSMQSHVLQEILDKEKLKRPSVRFSLSIYNTKADIDYVVGVLMDFMAQA